MIDFYKGMLTSKIQGIQSIDIRKAKIEEEIEEMANEIKRSNADYEK